MASVHRCVSARYTRPRCLNAKLAAAQTLVGDARYRRYGDLDAEIMRTYAPWAPYGNRNIREFISKRTGGYLFQPANGSADLAAFYIK